MTIERSDDPEKNEQLQMFFGRHLSNTELDTIEAFCQGKVRSIGIIFPQPNGNIVETPEGRALMDLPGHLITIEASRQVIEAIKAQVASMGLSLEEKNSGSADSSD